MPLETFATLIVTQSKVVQDASGATALVLYSREYPPIAFELSLEVIELLREDLSRAEAILRRPAGTG